MPQLVKVPKFKYAAFYPDFLKMLQDFRRAQAPELTDFSEFEPITVLEMAFALVGHINSINVDLSMNESQLITAKLQSSVRNHLRAIGFEIPPATPAVAPIVFKLTKAITSVATVVPTLAAVSDTATQAVFYEYLDDPIVVQQSEIFDAAHAEDNGVLTDVDVNSGLAWTPWAAPLQNNAVYFGMDTVMFDLLETVVDTAGGGYYGVWEYSVDGSLRFTPDDVIFDGVKLTFALNGYLGTKSTSGMRVIVRHLGTGNETIAETYWNGSTNLVDTNLLGQVNPSDNVGDYVVWAVDFEPIVQADELGQDVSDFQFELPQSTRRCWAKIDLGTGSRYYLRYRVVSVDGGATSPTMRRCRCDRGGQYVLGSVVQGRTQTESLGTATGEPNQTVSASQESYIAGTIEISVGLDQWEEVDSLIESVPTDKHFEVEFGTNDKPTILFGDGDNGSIPTAGLNIQATYRYGAALNGNVGANTITRDRSGLTKVDRLWNPRPAGGWSQGLGATELGLEDAKRLGAATLRHRGVLVNKDDAEAMVDLFVAATGASPYSRVVAHEGTFGEKTVEVVGLLKGGVPPGPLELVALEDWLNGDLNAEPPIPKKIVANTVAIASACSLKSVGVKLKIWGPVTKEQVVNQFRQFLHPEARLIVREDDGTYRTDPRWFWEYGGRIAMSQLYHIAHAISPSIKKVLVLEPLGDVQLGIRELPICGDVEVEIL